MPAANREPRPLPYRWVVFGILAAIYLLVYLHRQAPAVLAVDLRHSLGINGAWLGFISAAYFYPYALMQFPAGFMTRKWGPRLVLMASLGVAGLGAVFLAMASGPITALLGRTLVGLGAGAVLVSLLEIISNWFQPDKFVFMVGLLVGMGGLGVFMGSAPLAYLDHLLGWRGCFGAIAVITALLMLCLWWLVRDTPPGMCSNTPGGRAKNLESTDHTGGLGAILGNPSFWPPAIWGFCALAVFTSLGGLWSGPYLIHVHELSKIETGHVLAMLAWGMIAGSPLLAWLAERPWGSRLRVLRWAGVFLVGLCAVMVFTPQSHTTASLHLWFAALGLSTMAAAPLALSLARESVPAGASSLATGACNFFFLMGGAMLQPLVGLILDDHDGAAIYTEAHYTLPHRIYLGLALAAFIATLLAKEPKPRRIP